MSDPKDCGFNYCYYTQSQCYVPVEYYVPMNCCVPINCRITYGQPVIPGYKSCCPPGQQKSCPKGS